MTEWITKKKETKWITKKDESFQEPSTEGNDEISITIDKEEDVFNEADINNLKVWFA